MTFALCASDLSFDSIDRSSSYPFERFGRHKYCGRSTYGALLARRRKAVALSAPRDRRILLPDAMSLRCCSEGRWSNVYEWLRVWGSSKVAKCFECSKAIAGSCFRCWCSRGSYAKSQCPHRQDHAVSSFGAEDEAIPFGAATKPGTRLALDIDPLGLANLNRFQA
jgi:hypothetical protein